MYDTTDTILGAAVVCRILIVYRDKEGSKITFM